MRSPAIVILAAGESKRFGGIKQLAAFAGKPLLQCVIDNCRAQKNSDLYLVLGAHSEAILNVIEFNSSEVISNPNWSEGIGSSIRTATIFLQNRYDGLLFIAGDQPKISGAQLNQMLQKWLCHPAKMVAAQYQNTCGIPAIFPRRLYPDLMLLEGDRGAKDLLINKNFDTQLIDLPEAAVDIDYPSDLDLVSSKV